MYDKLPENLHLKAFTLIEVMVSITIIAVMFLVGVANFRGAERTKSIDSIRNQLISDLRQAQQYANGANKPSACVTPTDLELLDVSLVRISDTSYEIDATCDGPVVHSIQNQLTIPANYTLTFTPNIPVSFLPVAGGVQNAVTITITENTSGDERIININTAGEIR